MSRFARHAILLLSLPPRTLCNPFPKKTPPLPQNMHLRQSPRCPFASMSLCSDFSSRISFAGWSRVWDHAAILVCSDLVLNQSRKLAGLQSPAVCATRAGGDFDQNAENYGPSSQSPDTGHGAHPRLWRGEPGCRHQALASRVKCGGELAGFVARWPPRTWGRKYRCIVWYLRIFL